MAKKAKKAVKQETENDFSDFEEEMGSALGEPNDRPETENTVMFDPESEKENLIEECTIRMGQTLASRSDMYFRNGPEVKSLTAQAADLGFALAEEIMARKEARAHLRDQGNET